MNKHVRIGRFLRQRRILLAVSVLVTAMASHADGYTTGNLLTDPSFEANPLINFVDILTPPFTTNAWGAESATISGPADGITPADGSLMLSMTDDGLIATQAWQLIDVSTYAVDINAGLVTVDASALYNVPADILSGVSSLNIQFLDASHATIGLGVNVGSSTLTNGFVDSNVATWESLNITSAPLPVGTQYLRTQLAYGNASMHSNGVSRPGYVDATHLTLTAVPEPSTLILAASALLTPLLRRKRG